MYPEYLKPMSLLEVRKLKVGDKVYVYYAKDDDENDIRFDEICEVAEIDTVEQSIIAGSYWNLANKTWFSDAQRTQYETGNRINTSRGNAYFFWPEE